MFELITAFIALFSAGIFLAHAFEALTVATRYTGKWSDVTKIVVTGPSAEPFLAPDLLSL